MMNLDLLSMTLTEGLGPVRIGALLDRFGSAAAVLRASDAQLVSVPGIGPETVRRLREVVRDRFAQTELDRATRAGVQVVARDSEAYPPVLATLSVPPPILYVRGAITPADGRAVALVGSRRISDYGKRIAARLAGGLAKAGVTVVSGLARGADGIAHRATLQAGGRTLAVLAGGLSRIYPPEHTDLATEVSKAGALITESCMDQEPLAGLFPARNRIISGLCQAVVIIEAAEKSGALITAEHAAEQGRTVLAVPGAIDSEMSSGCNRLIRDGAVLCRGVDDILEEIDGSLRSRPVITEVASPVEPPPVLDDTQRQIWELLAQGSRSIDELVQQMGSTAQQMSGTLMMLEMKRIVRRLPGNRYERT